MFNLRLTIQQNQKIFDNYRLLSFIAPQIAQIARPGQFLMLRLSDSYEPLLPRPMSIHQIIRVQKGKPKGFRILLKISGRGTKLLAHKKEGDELQVIGPLGNGFAIDGDRAESLLVAGGIGVAPMLFLTEEMASISISPKIFIGAATSEDLLVLDKFKGLSSDLFITTEDGSQGYKGMITQRLEEYLRDSNISKEAIIYACGPREMLKQVAQLSRMHNLPCQLSLEARMACGVGACLGCAVKVKSEGKDYQYKRTCLEGPVFNAHEVIW